MNKQSKKGFTLIELLIVISIIGILAVALLPQILSAPASARDAAKQAALNQVAVALEQYNAASGSYPAAVAAGECMTTASSGTVKTALVPYFKNGALPSIAPAKDFDAAAPATCAGGIFYCKLTGNRYYLGVAMESPAVAGNGRLTAAADFTTGCDGTGAVPAMVTTAATNTYGILN